MDVFDLFAKISLDSSAYEKGLADSRKKGESFLSGLGSAFTRAGDFLLSTAKAAAAAVGAVGTAIGGIAKQSLEAYADFEQLEGGTALMFGDAYDFIMEKSQQAYQTVQLSQNEYLEQVNGFAIGLKTALGGNEKAAAELADKIVTAEADIVAATGNSQEAVQNAFNGIMKSNYTMLDNLQLGITPTKEGMQQVIDKVNEWNAAHGKATGYVIDNLADVQSALVDYVEMQGLSGYAANEASETIQGSIAGMKAAWQNFLTGAGSARQFTDMLKTVVGNIKPRIAEIVPRLTEGLTELVDLIAPELPALIEDTLPALLDASAALLARLAERLPQLLTVLAPSLMQGTLQVMRAIGDTLPQIASHLMDFGQKMLLMIWDGMKNPKNFADGSSVFASVLSDFRKRLPFIRSFGADIIGELVSGITEHAADVAPAALDLLAKLGTRLTDPEAFAKITDTAGAVIGSFIDGLTSQETIDKFFDTEQGIPKIITNLITNIGKLASKLIELAGKLVKNVSDYMQNSDNREKVYEAAKQILISLGTGLVKFAGELLPFVGELGVRLADMIWQSVTDGLAKLAHPETWGMDVTFNYSQAQQQAWLESGSPLSIDDWVKQQSELRAIALGAGSYEGLNYDEEAQKMLAYAEANGLNVPHFAEGAIVTKPTYALIGEAGTEAVVPLEKGFPQGQSVTIQFGDIYVTGGAQEIGREIVRQIDTALRTYQIQQARGIGGTAWQT